MRGIETPSDPDDGAQPASSTRFHELPERVRSEDLVATQEAEPAPDPTMGRDTERDFMLRYGLL